MSCFFRLGEVWVWNPSNQVASLFLAEATAVGKVLGCRCGIGEIEEDEIVIDGELFAGFVSVLLREHMETNNEVLRILVEGVLGASLVLLARARIQVEEMDADIRQPWNARVQHLSRSMPFG